MSLDQIVNVNITKATTAVTQAGFGTPMVCTYHERFAERALVFTSASSMLAANGGPFQPGDVAYQLANLVFSQSPRPPQVVVGRRQHPTIRTVDITPRTLGTIGTLDGLPRGTAAYTVSINGTAFTFTTDVSPTVAEITAGLTALINAGTENVIATDNTTSMRIEKAVTPGGAATAGVAFTLTYDRALMVSEDITPVAVGGGLAVEFAAISAVNDDWYGVVGDWFGSTEIVAASAAIEGLNKIHSANTQDDETLAGTAGHVGLLLQAAGYTRSWVNYHQTPHAGMSAGELGKNLPTTPGSITWKFKQLAGVSASSLTATEIFNLQAANMGFYRNVQGVNITCDGSTASGQFIDVTRTCDWLRSRIQEGVYSLFVNSPKVAYTDGDLAKFENVIRGVLALGVSNGAIAFDPAFTVTVPRAISVSTNDKANRILSNVTFVATIAGAVHSVVINGTLTL